MFYVYILQSQIDNRLYIGKTKNLRNRLNENDFGKSAYTKKYMPWDIIYYEAHTNEKDTARRETYLKTTQGYGAIINMLREHFTEQHNNRFIFQGSTTG